MTTERDARIESALAWALDEAEAQLREEPVHRLRDEARDHSWNFDSPTGVGVYVEVLARELVDGRTMQVTLHASSGFFSRHHTERCVVLTLDGDAARVPSMFYLVFEEGGHVQAFENLNEAGQSVETADLATNAYLAAYSDRGEVITMTPGDLWVRFDPTGVQDRERLTALIRQSRRFSDLADNPHEFALTTWLAS